MGIEIFDKGLISLDHVTYDLLSRKVHAIFIAQHNIPHHKQAQYHPARVCVIFLRHLGHLHDNQNVSQRRCLVVSQLSITLWDWVMVILRIAVLGGK